MSRLNIVVLTQDVERFRGALSLALAHAALGREARLFLQLDAVRLLASSVVAPRDEEYRAAGLPSLKTLLEEAMDAGVAIIACQSGMTLASVNAADLDPRIAAGGPISFLQSIDASDRLLSV